MPLLAPVLESVACDSPNRAHSLHLRDAMSLGSPHVAIMRAVVSTVVLAATVVLTAPADACPNCALGRQARAQVWNESFGLNLIVALLPFLLVAVICLCAEKIGRPRGDGAASRENEPTILRARPPTASTRRLVP
jgi:hypothetical protein